MSARVASWALVAAVLSSSALAEEPASEAEGLAQRRQGSKPSLQVSTVFYGSSSSLMLVLSPSVAYDFGWVELGVGVSALRLWSPGDPPVAWLPLLPRGHIALLPNVGVDLSSRVAVLFARTAFVLTLLPGTWVGVELGFDPIGLRISAAPVAITVRTRLTALGASVLGAPGVGVGAGLAVELALP